MEENYKLSHLRELEAESIHIIREVAAEFENPVMLYSIGKDSSVMVRLAEKAFYPGKVPFPLMHIDSKWKFREMIEFRDQYAKEHGWNLIVESNMEAFNAGVGPFTHGSKVHTDLMKTQALLHGLDKYRFDAAFGGARRDEEKSRAKERIFSFRDRFHQWDPKNQRPELWDIYNAKIHKGESIRVFPLSNWTELDIWQYIRLENIPIVPLYFAKERPVVNIDGNLIMADDDRLPEEYRDRIEMKKVRFRTLGCWPLTGAVESDADTIEKIVEEMMTTTKSERTTRVIDFDQDVHRGGREGVARRADHQQAGIHRTDADRRTEQQFRQLHDDRFAPAVGGPCRTEEGDARHFASRGVVRTGDRREQGRRETDHHRSRAVLGVFENSDH